MATKRSYDDRCAVAHALDLVGERWALLVVRELVFGPKRFTDLRTGMPSVSPNVLSQRLRELEQIGVVRRRKLPPPAGAWVYELTDWGQDLEPVIIRLARWGVRSPYLSWDAALSVDSLMLSFKGMFDPQAAEGIAARLELRFGEDRFRVQVADGRIDVARGSADRPDAVLETDQATLGAMIYGGRDLDEVVRSGDVVLHGDASAVASFLKLFPLPAPVPPRRPRGRTIEPALATSLQST